MPLLVLLLQCPVLLFLINLLSVNPFSSINIYFNLHAPSSSLVPCRTGYGALPSPTQRVQRSCIPQAVPVVTATASCGTQTIRLSAGSLCLRTWPRGTNSALATDKVKIVLQLINSVTTHSALWLMPSLSLSMGRRLPLWELCQWYRSD